MPHADAIAPLIAARLFGTSHFAVAIGLYVVAVCAAIAPAATVATTGYTAGISPANIDALTATPGA